MPNSLVLVPEPWAVQESDKMGTLSQAASSQTEPLSTVQPTHCTSAQRTGCLVKSILGGHLEGSTALVVPHVQFSAGRHQNLDYRNIPIEGGVMQWSEAIVASRAGVCTSRQENFCNRNPSMKGGSVQWGAADVVRRIRIGSGCQERLDRLDVTILRRQA